MFYLKYIFLIHSANSYQNNLIDVLEKEFVSKLAQAHQRV